MDKEARKKLTDAYKEQCRTQTGCIYIIKNRENGMQFIDLSLDQNAITNRFNSAKFMGGCPYGGNVKLTKDWAQYGADAFDFEVAESIDKNELQSPAEFHDDLEILKKMWIEKFDPAILY